MNEVTNFMYYIYNRWNEYEAEKLFGKDLGSHIWEKFLNQPDSFIMTKKAATLLPTLLDGDDEVAVTFDASAVEFDREKSTDRLLVFVKSEEVKGKFID